MTTTSTQERTIEDLTEWFDTRNRRRSARKDAKAADEEQKLKEECSFIPKINAVSTKIVENKFNNMSVVDRMDQDARLRQQRKSEIEQKIKDRVDEENPHNPIINDKSMKMEIQRLYEHGVEVMKEKTYHQENIATSPAPSPIRPNTPTKSLAFGRSVDPLESPKSILSRSKGADTSACSTKFTQYPLDEQSYGISLPCPLRVTHSFSGDDCIVNFVPYMSEYDEIYCVE